MKVVSLVGESGSGKTTAIERLIAHFVSIGSTVGAIKHTHHPLNDEDRGDTSIFRHAGAEPVILAGDGEAVMFEGDGTKRIRYEDPLDLLMHFNTDIVLIEGFKSVGDWPRIELDSSNHLSTAELLAIVDRIWRP